MNTDRLFEFQTLAQVLHYGRAAKKLYMAQSVLSRHIQELEKELGVHLFQRGPHGVALTSAGAALYRASWDYLQANEQAIERVRSAGIGVAGSVHFACLRPVMRNAIENFLVYFSETYPDVLLSADILTTPDECDLTAYHCLVMPSSAINVPDCFRLRATMYEKSWLVLPGRHRLQPGGEISLSELAGETLFIPGYHGTIGSFARIRQMAEQATGGRVHIIRVPSPETALLNTNLGKGFAIVPRHLLDERISNIHHATPKEDCRFEILFYKNESVDEPAARLFQDEFCRLVSCVD
ncbi:MAG: LysR family transcriptional regulator [Oscillospiraceae bacterium]